MMAQQIQKKDNLEAKIIETCLDRYNDNLAAVLVFGSYNAKPFILGVSDVDTIMLLKRKGNLDFEEEQAKLREELADIKLSIQHFRTLDDYEKHIYNEGSWSSWITVINGSKIIYSTNEFEEFRRRLEEKPLSRDKLKEYIEHKDEFELEGYLKKLSGWDITKAMFAHLRRKLQILNYYKGNTLEFDYEKCLDNLKDIKNKQRLRRLGQLYEERESLTDDEIRNFYAIAKMLTEDTIKSIR